MQQLTKDHDGIRALKENARQGFFNGSKPPFGYQSASAIPPDHPNRTNAEPKRHAMTRYGRKKSPNDFS
jgi:hypothetical protein